MIELDRHTHVTNLARLEQLERCDAIVAPVSYPIMYWQLIHFRGVLAGNYRSGIPLQVFIKANLSFVIMSK